MKILFLIIVYIFKIFFLKYKINISDVIYNVNKVVGGYNGIRFFNWFNGVMVLLKGDWKMVCCFYNLVIEGWCVFRSIREFK